MIGNIRFRQANDKDADAISALVCKLTQEITQKTGARLESNLVTTTALCRQLIRDDKYAALLAIVDDQIIALATYVLTHALYAGGKMGVIQEFYVCPEFRRQNIGSLLLAELKAYGKSESWKCIELCTPPLPEFDSALTFYQRNGLVPVGGRKMRENLS
ncbi:N-acetyltransferase family protein [Paraglaciecola sp.]|uniref:GNAT family N-acetyltransferase n=1 Tax=Paraglaciecola sp. TaxID=1920173 RepID=UPI003EFA45B3